MAAEVAQRLAMQRDAVLFSNAGLDVASVVRRSDIERAVALWREANAGHATERLLDGPPGEDERA